MIKELICICCPNGCHLQVDTEKGYNVSGNKCDKGAEYGKNELLHPVRVVTSTVVLNGGLHPRLPVKTDKAVPKDRVFAVMELLDTVRVSAPVKAGEILIENLFGLGFNVVACKDMDKI